MKFFLACAVLCALLPRAARADVAQTLCESNPAFAPDYMEKVVRQQLQSEHDPALDEDTPEHVAQRASAQGIQDCMAEMRQDPSIPAAMSGLNEADTSLAWDAFNATCNNHKASRGACITAEVRAADALNRMLRTNEPEGAKTLIQTCELVMRSQPDMAEWRECVDEALAVHASGAAAQRCKLSAAWHVARTGQEAGNILAACLRGAR